MSAPLVALDLFAGTGWGVACQWLGIEEWGVELMPEANATREANGMRNLYADVWQGLENALEVPPHDILIASPPCQTFSMAGNGAGRKALDEVLGLIDSRAYLDVRKLRAFGEAHDMRTALVLTPLAHIARDVPLYVILEQVPQVLPVWERYAVEMRKWGYSVVTGVLNAEQYGVPQTRKRAILIARADGKEARMPTPTHSRYYPNDKTKLDPDVEPWVSMAEALGWGMTERPYLTLAGGGPNGSGHTGAQDPAMLGGTGARKALRDERQAGRWVAGSPFNEGAPIIVRTSMGEPKVDGRNGTHELDATERPAHTVTTKVDSWAVLPGAKYFHPMTYGRRGIHPGDEPAPTIRGVQRDTPETYEPHPGDAVVFQGHQKPDSKRTSGEPDAYQTRETELPAPSITSGSRSAKWVTPPIAAHTRRSAQFTGKGRPDRSVDSPAPTLTGHDGHPRGGFEWIVERPATTVQGDPRVWPPGHKVNADDIARHDDARERYGDRAGTDSVRVTVAEAAALQTYPADFDWSPMVPVMRSGVPTGKLAPMSKTKAFLQIGNAVPPLLAAHVLSTILD